MSAVLNKPQLRGLLAKRLKFHLIGATVSSLAVGYIFKLLYIDPRKKRHAEYHKNYDAAKHFKVMYEHNLLQSKPYEGN